MSTESNLDRVRFLESERLFLTPLSLDDVDDHYRWDHDREMQYLDGCTYRPTSYEKVKEEIESSFKSKKAMFFSVINKQSGVNMGSIMLFRIDDLARTAEWGIKLDRKFRRQAYGSEAARLLIKYAFEDLCLVKLESGTHSDNPASARLQECLGMVREGVQRKNRYLRGQYYDSILFGMTADEYRNIYAQGKGKKNE